MNVFYSFAKHFGFSKLYIVSSCRLHMMAKKTFQNIPLLHLCY